MGLLKKIVSAVAAPVTQAVKGVASGIGQAAKNIGKALGNIVKKPLPVIETIGLTLAGVPPPIASAAVAAANGAKVGDIALAAATVYAGGQVGAAAGESAAAAGSSASTAQIAASAAGASTAAVTKALATGQPLDQAISSALTAGVIGGTAAGAVEGIKAGTTERVPGLGIKAIPGEGTQLFAPDQQGYGITSRVPTEGGQGIFADPNVVLPASLAAYATPPSQVKAGAGGQVVPRYTAAGDYLTPTGMEAYNLPQNIPQKVGPGMDVGGLSKEGEQAARTLIGYGLGSAFQPVSQQSQTSSARGGGATLTGISSATPAAGSEALGQALRIGDPGAPIFGGEKDKGKKSGWNVESLRYMGQEN
jgi:hypothetical protein